MDKTYYFETEHMTVGYHGVPLIKNIEIKIKQGEILTLIGPNGSGKSTILKSITKQLAAISGTIYLDCKSVSAMTEQEIARKMSLVMTGRIQAELMTCEDIVSTGRYPYTGRLGILTEEDQRKVREAMELVHVEELAERDFSSVSDGQKQRVLLARAICQEPKILILDEPTSYLDVKYKLEFLSILQEMRKKKGLTVIMSLHELELAERISDQLLCVKGEYIERYGTPEEIFSEGSMRQLFDIQTGSYDEKNGTMELERPEGIPKVFVIAGGGSGKKTYRRLQREGQAFAAGILYENDVDHPAAKALAAQVITAEAFEPVNPALLEEAKRAVDVCERVICCRSEFGSLEWANRELLAYAEKNGKDIQMETT